MRFTKDQKKWLIIAIVGCGIIFLTGIFDDNSDDNNIKKKDNNKINIIEKKQSKQVQENKTEIKKESKTNIQNDNSLDYDIEISIKEMSEIYYNNELDGNKKFFGNKVKTQAKFSETSNGMFSSLIAYFDGIDSIYNIHCTSFEKETKKILSTFNRNETVNIIGIVDELIGSSIKFKDCKIYK